MLACKSGDLHVLAYAWGFTLWRCSARHTSYDVLAEGYFNATCEMVNLGDKIIIGTTDRPCMDLAVIGVGQGTVYVEKI